MPTQRILFEVPTNAADTGTQGDTGPVLHGELSHFHWNPTVADTGGDLTMAVLPKAGDTGDGWNIYSKTDILGANFTAAPRQPQHGVDGAADPADTGAAFGVPIIFAGDRLRIKLVPAGGSPAGRLYVYLKN